jgi:hypothetical protein
MKTKKKIQLGKRGQINKRKRDKRKISKRKISKKKRKYMRTKNKQKGGSSTSGKDCKPCTEGCEKTFVKHGLEGLRSQCICNKGKTKCWCDEQCRKDHIEGIEDTLRETGKKDWS